MASTHVGCTHQSRSQRPIRCSLHGMDWQAVWKALCIAWQQGPVQRVVDCFEQTSAAGVSEEAQDALVGAMTLTEQHLHARLPEPYAYRLYSGLSKAAERHGHGFSEALMASLADALCSASATKLPNSDPQPATTPRCYFYGPDPKSAPDCHPHLQWVMAQLGQPCSPRAQQSAQSAAPVVQHPRTSTSDATGDTQSADGGTQDLTAASTAACPPAGAPGSTDLARPSGHVLVLGSCNMLEGGTGCHLWPAGLWLAQWLMNNPHVARGRRCLELGAGTGLVGAVCAQLGASQVCVTDGNAAALENCRVVLQMNGLLPAERADRQAASEDLCSQAEAPQSEARVPSGERARVAGERGLPVAAPISAGTGRRRRDGGPGLGVDVRVELLEWGTEAVEADVVLAADVVYDDDAVRRLAVQLQAQLVGPTADAYVVSEVRCPDTLQLFLDECARHGLRASLEEAAVTDRGEGGSVLIHHCWELEQRHEVVLHRVTAA